MRKRAFTLIELLVVVAIIALLIAILLPSLAKSKQTTQRTICGTNLKSQGSAMAIYAASNTDFLPNVTNQSYYGVAGPEPAWLHDWSNPACQLLLGAASSLNGLGEHSIARWFYCPTNTSFVIADAWAGKNPTTGTSSINAQGVGYRFVDYNYFIVRGSVANGWVSSSFSTQPAPSTSIGLGLYQRASNKQPPIQLHSKLAMSKYASDAEMAIDEMLTNQPPDAGNSIDWTQGSQASYFHEQSSHLYGKRPQGMNALCFDGHVAWRGWVPPGRNTASTAFQQAAPSTGGGGGPSGQATWMYVIDPE